MSHDTSDLFRLVAGNVPDNIMLLDRDERIEFINWTVPSLTIDQVLGTKVADYVAEEGRAAMRTCFDRVYETKVPDHYETQFEAPDGSVTVWDSRVAPIVEDGEVTRMAVVSSNITEAKEAAADLERFFKLSLDLLCVLAHNGTIKRTNRGFSSRLGYEAADVIGKPLVSFVHTDDRSSAERLLERLRAGEDVDHCELRVKTTDGAYRVIEWQAVAMSDIGLSYAGGRDVTEHRLLEQQLRQSQKMDAVGQLAGGISHDFNNLVLTILVNTDFALEHVADSEAQKCLNEVKRAAQRAAALTRQLLAFSRQQSMDMAPVDCNELVEGMLEMLRRTIPRTIELDLICGKKLPKIHGDAGQVEQVLLNLCINARDAMPDGGRLCVETETVVINGDYRTTHPWAEPGRYVLISVADTGVGMSLALRERVFEPFFTTKPAGKGTGLGLATAYGIVQQHGGVLHVSSEEGRGSTFKVYLPAAEPSASDVGTKLTDKVVGGTETILVAEDSDQVRDLVVRVLERAGYHVITATTGVEAIERIENGHGKIDLALLDVVMPEMGGPRAAIRIRELAPDLEILFTSGYAEGEGPNEDIPPGRLVEKPYEPQALLRRIRRVLDR